jgi:Flp pilus assembly protein TadD
VLWRAAFSVAVLAAGGCAAREPSLTARFITPGRPAVDLGGPTPALLDGGAARSAGPPPAAVRAAARRSANLSTLEATSPPLRRALLAVSIQPTAARYLEVAAAYRAVGIGDRAFDFLTEGLQRHPSDPALHDALARQWRDWGFPDRGLTAAHRAVYHAPDSAEVHNTLGTVLWALGERTEARQAFAAATALDPRAWYAWRNLCTATMAAGDTRAAAAQCRRATALRAAAGGEVR